MMIPSPANNAPRVGLANFLATAASATLTPIEAIPAANRPDEEHQNGNADW